MDEATLEGIIGLFQDFAAVRYTNIAFLMLLFYDHALTFDLEVSRIWTLPWRMPKILFLVNRYLIPPMLLFDGLTPAMKLSDPVSQTLFNGGSDRVSHEFGPYQICDFIAKWTPWPTILSIGTVEVMLILRVSAMFAHSKEMTRFLIAFFTIEMIAWFIISLFILFGTHAIPGNESNIGCLFSAPSYFFAAWIPAVIFESVIIILTVYKTLKYDKVGATLAVLARDSILYFSAIFVMLISNLFIARFGKGFLGALLIVPCSVVACIAAARMTMNIREFTMTDSTYTTGHELPTIQFQQGLETTTQRTEP